MRGCPTAPAAALVLLGFLLWAQLHSGQHTLQLLEQACKQAVCAPFNSGLEYHMHEGTHGL
eukprot:132467-Pelagomonas_calceolata.AAC.3